MQDSDSAQWAVAVLVGQRLAILEQGSFSKPSERASGPETRTLCVILVDDANNEGN